MNDTNFFEAVKNPCFIPDESFEDPRINRLRKVSYGFVMPAIILFGIVGNVLNLLVLSRRNMQGIAYIYMRGYSLLAIGFCIPFTLRVLLHESAAGWTSYLQALYHVHLELYLGNGCLGVGVMMLLALTLERHASVCRPGQYGRPVCGPPRLAVSLLPLFAFLAYLPGVFRASVSRCSQASDRTLFQKRDNLTLLQSPVYQVYKVALELVFKIGPTLLLAVLNLRITLAYRRTCERRRRMRRRDTGSFAEERRLMLLLGSTRESQHIFLPGLSSAGEPAGGDELLDELLRLLPVLEGLPGHSETRARVVLRDGRGRPSLPPSPAPTPAAAASRPFRGRTPMRGTALDNGAFVPARLHNDP